MGLEDDEACGLRPAETKRRVSSAHLHCSGGMAISLCSRLAQAARRTPARRCVARSSRLAHRLLLAKGQLVLALALTRYNNNA